MSSYVKLLSDTECNLSRFPSFRPQSLQPRWTIPVKCDQLTAWKTYQTKTVVWLLAYF